MCKEERPDAFVYSRGVGKCESIEYEDIEKHDVRMANQIVFVFQVIQTLQRSNLMKVDIFFPIFRCLCLVEDVYLIIRVGNKI